MLPVDRADPIHLSAQADPPAGRLGSLPAHLLGLGSSPQLVAPKATWYGPALVEELDV